MPGQSSAILVPLTFLELALAQRFIEEWLNKLFTKLVFWARIDTILGG